jgi:hypothetical protein
MLRVGYRIRLSSGKGPDREGVITAVIGSMLRVRWPSQEETTVIPAAGTLTVLDSSGDRAPSAVPPEHPAAQESHGQESRPQESLAQEGCGEEDGAEEDGAEEGCAQEGCGEEDGAEEDGAEYEQGAGQDSPQQADRQGRQREADGREAPGSLIHGAQPSTSPRESSDDSQAGISGQLTARRSEWTWPGRSVMPIWHRRLQLSDVIRCCR